jgi:hypothetical protein
MESTAIVRIRTALRKTLTSNRSYLRSPLKKPSPSPPPAQPAHLPSLSPVRSPSPNSKPYPISTVSFAPSLSQSPSVRSLPKAPPRPTPNHYLYSHPVLPKIKTLNNASSRRISPGYLNNSHIVDKSKLVICSYKIKLLQS